jgi:hypothetical protein
VQFNFRYNSQKLTLGAPVPAAENSPLRIATAHEPGQLAVLLYRTSERCLSAGQRELLQIPLRIDAADFSVTDLQIEGELMVGENGRVMPLEVRYGEMKLQTGLPERFELGQNYPNPFSLHAPSALGGNATTEIVYTLPTASQVRLSILNLMGQEIAVLVEARQTAGIKKVTWDGSNQAGAPANSGIYFYRLQAENFVATKKMLVTR